MNWKYFKPKFEYEESFDDMSWPWVGHRYFAYDLVSNMKPKLMVELGTHRGTSLFSFAQAVKDNFLETEINAVDTWQGDEHAGFYNDEIYDGVRKNVEKYYNNVNIKLIRKTFDKALSDFEDKSIDILHIDGLHTYEAVKHDFETWFPKVKDNGIILFHDIVVTRDDFGVFHLWKELKDGFETMEFRHSYGLGVLFKDKKNEIISVKNNLELYYSYLLEDIENGKIEELRQNYAAKEKEIDIRDKEIKEKDGEVKKLNMEIEEKDGEVKKLNKEIDLIKSSKFWKIRNFYLKTRHYFIFIFLNPRKFIKKQIGKLADISRYYNEHGLFSTLTMIFRKILPYSVYIFFHRLYNRFYLIREFSGKNKVIIVFPVINWNSRWQRPQQILSRFADCGYKIIYLQMAIIGTNKIAKNKKEGFDMFSIGKIYKNVYELTLSGKKPFDIHSNKISPDNLKNFTIQILSLMESYKIKNPYYMVHFPNWSDLVFSLKENIGGTVIFDCMDDHSGFSTASEDIVETERELINKSDIIISSSTLLYERNSKNRENSLLVKNGTEYGHFNKIYKNGKLNNIKKPIIGYYGAINDWFDMEIVKYCAENRPEWNFVLIGGTDNKNFEKDKLILEGLSNVFFLGEKKYSDLPGYVGYFDVCIIPFKLIPLIMATNPVKFYEYISSGKPVVSVELPELLPYKDICYLAKDKEDFLEKLEKALGEDDLELKTERMKIAKENSWDARYKYIKDELIKFNKKK